MTDKSYYENLLKEHQFKLEMGIHAITNMCKCNNSDDDIIAAAKFITDAADNVNYYTKYMEENFEE